MEPSKETKLLAVAAALSIALIVYLLYNYGAVLLYLALEAMHGL